MPAITDLIGRSVDQNSLRLLCEQIDAEETATKKAIAIAFPLIIGSLARNANESHSRAQELLSSIRKNHDGSLLENLNDILTRSGGGGHLTDASSGVEGGYTIDRKTADGDGILKHLLDNRRSAVELGISQASGLEVSRVHLLMPILAVTVMSALAVPVLGQKLDADGVARLLNRERADVEKMAPELKRGSLMDYMESNDDGQIIKEVQRIGSLFVNLPMVHNLLARSASVN